MAKVFIGIGSNLGDRLDFIRKSVQFLDRYGIRVVKTSEIIETPPYGFVQQPNFLNCVVQAESFYSPLHLLNALQMIETALGRVRTVRWGPRTIDLDILFYEDLIVDTPRLKIPHPDMQNRLFVLVPLAQIAPEKVHPKLGKTVSELLIELRKREDFGKLSR